LKTLLGLLLVVATTVGACRSSSPGGRPTDGGPKDGPVDSGPPKVDAYCPADAMGGGQCPINFCGQVKIPSALPQNEVPTSGADTLCNAGRVCVVGSPLATNDGFQLVCQPPTGTAAFGAACTPGGGQCAAESLCVASPDFPQEPFCSAMCRNDADCPAGTGTDGPARCINYQTQATLADGTTRATIGMCTPAKKIKGTPCLREADCTASEGCVFYAGRTGLRVCRATGGTKAMGTACASNAECRSGECYDREGTQNGGTNRTFCSGPCVHNSDCSADQRCARLVVSNNGTPTDPLDDVVSGYCQTLFPPALNQGCQDDANCVARQDGSDTCDVTHGLCYKKTAAPGSACTRDTECMFGGTCSMGPRFSGGYCQTFGCDQTKSTGIDACPAGSVCGTRGGPDEPIGACYEACTPPMPERAAMPCSRAAAHYTCEAVSTSDSTTICLFNPGT
jgi:hypothetical protein